MKIANGKNTIYRRTSLCDHFSQTPKFCLSNYYSWNSMNATTSRDLTVTSFGADGLKFFIVFNLWFDRQSADRQSTAGRKFFRELFSHLAGWLGNKTPYKPDKIIRFVLPWKYPLAIREGLLIHLNAASITAWKMHWTHRNFFKLLDVL